MRLASWQLSVLFGLGVADPYRQARSRADRIAVRDSGFGDKVVKWCEVTCFACAFELPCPALRTPILEIECVGICVELVASCAPPWAALTVDAADASSAVSACSFDGMHRTYELTHRVRAVVCAQEQIECRTLVQKCLDGEPMRGRRRTLLDRVVEVLRTRRTPQSCAVRKEHLHNLRMSARASAVASRSRPGRECFGRHQSWSAGCVHWLVLCRSCANARIFIRVISSRSSLRSSCRRSPSRHSRAAVRSQLTSSLNVVGSPSIGRQTMLHCDGPTMMSICPLP